MAGALRGPARLAELFTRDHNGSTRQSVSGRLLRRSGAEVRTDRWGGPRQNRRTDPPAVGYLEAPLNLNPSDRETKTASVTRVMLRVSSNQKDEVDAAFRYRIYRMAGVLSRKDSRTSRWKFQDDEVIFLLYVC